MASGIYGYPVAKKTHKMERAFGKQAVLGLGYQMGFLTFLLTCRKFGIHFTRAEVRRIMGDADMIKYVRQIKRYLCMEKKPEKMSQVEADKWKNKVRQAGKARRQLTDAREVPKDVVHELALMKYTVDVYRKRYEAVKKMWYANEEAAILAIRIRDKIVALEAGDHPDPSSELYEQARVECGKVTWFVDRELDVLQCELPSKRLLTYHNPTLKTVMTDWGETKPSIRFMGTNAFGKWSRQHTYGGKLVENITQAVARDIMANAMLTIDAHDTYSIMFTVHDEVVCSADPRFGTIEEFEKLMIQIPEWAEGCPVDAEGEKFFRYRK